jgi:uncharacterized protein YhfF
MAFRIVDGYRALEVGAPGAMRQRLNQLILDGHKRATAGLLLDYVREHEEVESEGELLSLVDDEDRRLATVRVKQGATVPFIEVPWAFAQAEAEGDESLEEWRGGHRRFWADGGDVVEDLTPVVLIWFEVLPDI